MIRETPHGRPPGYPYFLAFIYLLSGSSYVAPRIVQMAFGLLNVVLMFLFGRAVFGRAVGLIAAAFMSTYWIFIHFEGELTYPSLVVFISLLMMHMLRFWTLKPSYAKAAIIGLLLGAFALFRPNVVLFGPAMVMWMFWVLGGRRELRRFLITAAIAGTATVAAISPALIRNVVVAHDFVFLSSYGGVNIWAGNNENADCVTPKIPHLKEIAGFEDWTCFHYPLIVRGVGRILGKENIKFSEASSYFYKQGVDFIVHHPLKTAVLLAKKTLIFWGPIETTNDKVLHYEKKNSRLLHLLPGFPFVLALFATGLVLLARDWRAILRNHGDEAARMRLYISTGVALFIFTYYASVVPYFVAGRYRVPVIPFLLLIGAYGARRVYLLYRDKNYKTAGICCAFCASVYIIGSIPFVSYKPDLAIWRQQRATAYEEAGDFVNAEKELREEIIINPNYAAAHKLLASVLIKQGKIQDGVSEYQETLRLDPSDDLALNNLGYEAAKQGDAAKADQYYEQALRVNPNLPIAHNNRGNLYLRESKIAEAVAEFETALKLDPNDRFAEYNLANALRAEGDSAGAIPHYLRAMKLDARNPDIPNNLGLACADKGDAGEAVRWYREALRLNPKYANAHNNIGFEYSKQGKVQEAEVEYEEALRLDPNLSLALNNLGRLFEDQGKNEDALGKFRRAAEVNPKDGAAFVNIGDLYTKQGKYSDAVPEYLRAIERDPKNADALNNLANAYVRLSQFEKAVDYYNKALAVNPRHIGAHCNLGAIFSGIGKTDEAAAHFKAALEAAPNSKEAQEGLRRLGR
jgi:tetratricopeptide (TPR) repeat protein